MEGNGKKEDKWFFEPSAELWFEAGSQAFERTIAEPCLTLFNNISNRFLNRLKL